MLWLLATEGHMWLNKQENYYMAELNYYMTTFIKNSGMNLISCFSLSNMHNLPFKQAVSGE